MTVFRRVAALSGVVVVSAVVGVGCLSAPRWQGPLTEHFDGDKFVTPGAPEKHGGFSSLSGLKSLLDWQLHRQPGPWREYRDEPFGPRPPAQVPMGAMRVTFINHATTLIQLDGVNVITDPIYAERCSPVSFAGPKRVRPPGIRFEDLPRIDVIVLSHNHYDHLDVATLKRLTELYPHARIFAGLGNAAFLTAQKLGNVTELDWWEHREVNGVTITSVPNQHFSNRGVTDGDGTLWSAWALTGSNGSAFFGGDTGYGPHFKTVGDRLGPFRLAVLPIGAYKPEWFMSPIHMSPEQAVEAANDLRAGLSVPMHYGTFNLADDGETEPLEALAAALQKRPTSFAVLGFGEGRDVPEGTP